MDNNNELMNEMVKEERPSAHIESRDEVMFKNGAVYHG
jgi:hypothetical protein